MNHITGMTPLPPFRRSSSNITIDLCGDGCMND
jgi:hypothetical protein